MSIPQAPAQETPTPALGPAEQALAAWRERWEEQRQARLAAEAEALASQPARRPGWVAPVAVGALAAATAGVVLVVAVVTHFTAPDPTRAQSAPAPQATLAPIATPSTTIQVPMEAIALPTPSTPAIPSTPALTPAVATEAPTAVASGPAVSSFLHADTVRVWSADGTQWAQVDFQRGQAIELRWLDVAGNETLDRIRCGGVVDAATARCFIGRTEARIQRALDAGEANGTWTVQACSAGTSDCLTLGSFVTP